MRTRLRRVFCPARSRPVTWTAVVNAHMVMPGKRASSPQIRGTFDPKAARGHAPRRGGCRQTARRGPGWYRGDLHAHTLHSDGEWGTSSLVADARSRGLDFVTLSDHNTISGLAELDAAAGDDLLTIPGMELTTFWGMPWRSGCGIGLTGGTSRTGGASRPARDG